MLLWMLILTLFGAMVAVWGGNLPPSLRARVLGVQATDRGGVLRLHPRHLQSLLAACGAAARRQRPEPAAAGPRPRLPSAVPLPRLRRALDGLFLRHRRADRGPGRRRLGALGAALDAARLGVPDHRHRHGLDLGLLRARLGRLVVLGPGRERQLHALADRLRAPALGDRRREARHAEELDDPARDPRLLLQPRRRLHRALGDHHQRARLRRRPGARGLPALDPRGVHRRLADALRLAGADAALGDGLLDGQPRERAGRQQPASGGGDAGGVLRHASGRSSPRC